jgi:nucleoside-diphosphate-sugar epimerase
MKTMVLGATGYVGSRIAEAFRLSGHQVSGLARTGEGEAKLLAAGVTPVRGDLAAPRAVARTLDDDTDVVVYAARVPFEQERIVIDTLLDELARPGRTLIFISGSGVVSTPARDGAWNDYTAAEDDPYPFPAMRNRAVRLGTERSVIDAATSGLRTFVIRPPLIWGHAGSIQIPQLFESARRTGAVCYLGLGLNLYSHVHVDDVAALSLLAVEKGVAGRIYHAVAGEANFRTIAEAIGEVTGCPTRSLSYAEAVDLWGAQWVDLGLAVNSRIRAPRTRAELDWTPTHLDVIEDIRHGSYRRWYQTTGMAAAAYSWDGHG